MEQLRSHHLIFLGSTEISSATIGYLVVPERFGQFDEPAGRKEKRARKKPSFVTSSGYNQCSMKTHVNMNFIHLLYVFF